ncbi:MAG: NAD(+) diphosphatase [Desulfuromonadaceae bacterium]|nr:NAD(+) diphosphatase [Desulfuromonadaceae bacterium]MDD5104969.1 NAD(+) diphosphatase [Desulfuromonadaceae bacterium]
MSSYPDLINIPFNNIFIRDMFVPGVPYYSPTSHEPGYWVIIQGNKMILLSGEALPTLPFGDLPDWLDVPDAPLTIGLWRGRPLRIFTADVRSIVKEPFMVEALNTAIQTIDNAILGIGGIAKQILYWEHQSGFCSVCGGPTLPFAREWGRSCSVCNAKHFPRISPCAIVFVRRDDEVLLVRNAAWPTGRYSLAAGFLNFGESLEDCAAREVKEETGIDITDITYVGSQSWPFPSQLMAGFVARYANGDLVVDHAELEDARWFPISGLPTLPPTRSIARRIIDTFCHC